MRRIGDSSRPGLAWLCLVAAFGCRSILPGAGDGLADDRPSVEQHHYRILLVPPALLRATGEAAAALVPSQDPAPPVGEHLALLDTLAASFEASGSEAPDALLTASVAVADAIIAFEEGSLTDEEYVAATTGHLEQLAALATEPGPRDSPAPRVSWDPSRIDIAALQDRIRERLTDRGLFAELRPLEPDEAATRDDVYALAQAQGYDLIATWELESAGIRGPTRNTNAWYSVPLWLTFFPFAWMVPDHDYNPGIAGRATFYSVTPPGRSDENVGTFRITAAGRSLSFLQRNGWFHWLVPFMPPTFIPADAEQVAETLTGLAEDEITVGVIDHIQRAWRPEGELRVVLESPVSEPGAGVRVVGVVEVRTDRMEEVTWMVGGARMVAVINESGEEQDQLFREDLNPNVTDNPDRLSPFSKHYSFSLLFPEGAQGWLQVRAQTTSGRSASGSVPLGPVP